MLSNLVFPAFFLQTLEAKVVLLGFFVAGSIQMAIFRSKGFVRLLGVGHIIPWVPLVLWLGGRLGAPGSGTPFRLWIVAVILLNSISLLIDFVDLVRYTLGERKPSYVLQEKRATGL